MSRHNLLPHQAGAPRKHSSRISSSSGNAFLFSGHLTKDIPGQLEKWEYPMKKHDWWDGQFIINLCLMGIERIWPWPVHKVGTKLSPAHSCVSCYPTVTRNMTAHTSRLLILLPLFKLSWGIKSSASQPVTVLKSWGKCKYHWEVQFLHPWITKNLYEWIICS